MRSRTSCNVSAPQVHSWALGWLLEARLLKDHGWKCTAVVVLNVVLRAAVRTVSLSAACRDLAKGPSDQAVMNALDDGLPKTLPVLERRLNEALTNHLPRRLRRRSWQVAIDWHLSPYYGEPERSRNELYYGKPRQGTKKFHAYASACIVSHGRRYTIALTWVRRHESMVRVLQRLIARIREIGLKIGLVLVDRAFFNVAVVQFLKAEQLPFLMPVVFRGRRPRPGSKLTGLRAIRRRPAGWYEHTMRYKGQEATVRVCVGYRTHRNRKDRKRKQQKLVFAAWKVRGTPTSIRERYRKRFGIETSYRQMREARIRTCARDPHLRLVFMAVALLLRNVWVWIHHTLLAEGREDDLKLHLEKLRFAQMLEWIAREIIRQFHDGSTPSTAQHPP